MAMIDDIKTIIGKKPKTESKIEPKKILIVEDDHALGSALELKLQHEGFVTIRGANGQEGLDLIKSEKPDVVLLDLMMPVMDGRTMLTKIREIEEFKKLPVIVLTNAGAVENIHETQRINEAVEFLVKSNTSLEIIVDRIKRYIHAS